MVQHVSARPHFNAQTTTKAGGHVGQAGQKDATSGVNATKGKDGVHGVKDKGVDSFQSAATKKSDAQGTQDQQGQDSGEVMQQLLSFVQALLQGMGQNQAQQGAEQGGGAEPASAVAPSSASPAASASPTASGTKAADDSDQNLLAKFDTDGDGKLSDDELKAALESLQKNGNDKADKKDADKASDKGSKKTHHHNHASKHKAAVNA